MEERDREWRVFVNPPGHQYQSLVILGDSSPQFPGISEYLGDHKTTWFWDYLLKDVGKQPWKTDNISLQSTGKFTVWCNNKDSVSLQGKFQVGLLPIIKDSSSQNLGFLSSNVAPSLCKHYLALSCIILWKLRFEEETPTWCYFSYCYCCK